MASVMLAVSCVRVQEGMSSLPALPISWRTVETKAASPFPEDQTFISYAWFSLPDGETWSDGSNEPRLYIDGAKISYYDADGWHAGSPFFWPLEGTLSFFSYAPSDMPLAEADGGSGVSVTKDGVRLDNWNVLDGDDKPKNIDFMVADPAKDLTATGAAGGVPTLFRHTMTRVRVNIIDDGSSESEIKITSITLNDIYCTGSYAAGSWGSTSARSNLKDISLPLPATTIGAGLRTDYVIMLPQNLLAVSDNEHDVDREAPSMTIIYSNPADPGTTTANIKFADWLGSSYWTAGHDITYTVTFGSSTDPIDFGAEVGDWTDIDGVTVSGK